MSEIDPIPPALKALYDDERAAPIGGSALERERIRLRVLATVSARGGGSRAASAAPRAMAAASTGGAGAGAVAAAGGGAVAAAATSANLLDPGPPPVRLEEADLLARWGAGNVAAGQQLFREYYNVVSRYLSNKVGGTAHGDLVQRTFLACLTGSAQLGGASSFRTFLLRIAHRELIAHLARAHLGTHQPEPEPGRDLDLDAMVIADSFHEPHSVAAQQQEHRLLLAVLRRLPLTLQVMLELRYWESLTDREIGEVLGVPRETVKTRLREGRLRLRRDLARNDASPDLVRSSLDTLDGWAERARSELLRQGGDRRAAGSSPGRVFPDHTTGEAEARAVKTGTTKDPIAGWLVPSDLLADLAGTRDPAEDPAEGPPLARRSRSGTPPPAIGRFVLERRLGVSATSVVYAAYDTALDRRVALKLVSWTGAEGERVPPEARALVQLQHPNVVAIHDVGEWNGHLFVAMELVAGETLARWQGAQRRPWQEVVRRYLAAGRGLEAVHSVGLVHRDFKPANVRVDGDRVMVTGVELAAAAGPDDRGDGPAWRFPRNNTTYLAPELRAGGPPRPSEDVYSFSIALCEALLGRHPSDPGFDWRRALRRVRLPRRVRVALEHGMADDPGQRARLSPLLAELEAALRRRMRWWRGP